MAVVEADCVEAQHLEPVLYSQRLTLTLYDATSFDERTHILACLTEPKALEVLDGLRLESDEDVIKFFQPLVLKACDSSGKDFGQQIPTYLVHEGSNNPRGPLVGLVITASFEKKSGISPMMGWFILESYSGKGYAIEAALRVRDYWTKEIGIEQVGATILPTNNRSIQLALRLGMKPTSEELNENGRIEWIYRFSSEHSHQSPAHT